MSEKNSPLKKWQPGLQKTGTVLSQIGDWIWRLRKVFFSIPVVWCALYLARLNRQMLPASVGIGLQASGEYLRYVSRNTAVYLPLAVTGACLLLMFLSKKTLYPWMISAFSLALPAMILLVNLFPL